MKDVTVSLEREPRIDILNSIVFHNNPAVDFDFVAVSITVCAVSTITLSAGWVEDLYSYISTLLLVRISQRIYQSICEKVYSFDSH
jgi:hypothetical protein